MSEEIKKEGRLDTFLSSSVVDLFTEQYLHELDNAFTYKFFSSWAAIKGFVGAKKWFQHQYKEELSHANKIRDFLTDAGVYFSLSNVPVEALDVEDYSDLFKQAMIRETTTTDSINKIMIVCGKEGQLLAQEFMNVLLYNQLAEEEEARTRYQISVRTQDNILADHQIGEL